MIFDITAALLPEPAYGATYHGYGNLDEPTHF
jgi:hypothetical protein